MAGKVGLWNEMCNLVGGGGKGVGGWVELSEGEWARP